MQDFFIRPEKGKSNKVKGKSQAETHLIKSGFGLIFAFLIFPYYFLTPRRT
jgi:hypothetical protein